MGGGQMETPERGEPQPGQDGRLATAAGIPNIAQGTARAKADNLTRHSLALLAASLDPAALAALGLVGARIWGALA